MFRLLACFLYVLPACGMDFSLSNLADLSSSDTSLPISDSEFFEEECPLLNKEIPQDEAQILANSILVPIDLSSIPISTTDLLSPFSNRHPTGLPKDIFWFIISLCGEKDILNLCETSTHFRNVLRKLIPILTPLTARPSSVQILNFLEEIEYWKESHKQLSKSAHNVRDVLNVFPRYWEELDRLSLAQTYVRFSPHFWWHNGSNRVQRIRDYYGIDAPKGDWCELPLHIISSILRDPYGIHMTCTGIAFLTAVGGWYLYKLGLATEEFNRATIQINTDYAHTLQKNLEYAQSEAYYSTAVPNVTFHTYQDQKFGGIKKCFSLICDTPFICIDTRLICQPEVIVNQTPDFFFTDAQKLVGNSLSTEELKKYVIDLLNQTCNLNDWPKVHHGYSYSYNIRHKNQWFILDLYDAWKFHKCNYNIEGWERCLAGKKDGAAALFSFDLLSYDPNCITKYLTPIPQIIPIPSYIPMGTLAWSLGIGGTWLSFIVLLFLGWCMGI